MNGFLTSLDATHLQGKWWRIKNPLVYRDGEMIYIVPPGFVTDFASVPRLPLLYLLTGNTEHAAAALHDLQYRWGFLSRSEADRQFLEAMKSLRWGSRLRRTAQAARQRVMYLGTVAGGYGSYRRLPGQLDPRLPYELSNHYIGWHDCAVPIDQYVEGLTKF